MPKTVPSAPTYSLTTVPTASVVVRTVKELVDTADAAEPGTAAACDTELLTVAPEGAVMGVPPKTAWAGDMAAKLNVNPAARLTSARARRKPNEMTEVSISLLRFDYFRRCTILSAETPHACGSFFET